ncbi:MAG: Hpt domain-containing protein, partial [Desulfobulbaceae bacterium]|nr:Hpt domain-containing protein [Desulfobulbaceae bacterium]
MAEVEMTSFEHVEAIALKIMMVEPGNLSVIGELFELIEKMVASPSVRKLNVLWNMGKALGRVLEKMIIGDLADDSVENFELLADCISLMQEIDRLKGVADDKILGKFCDNMTSIGLQMNKNDLTGQDEGRAAGEAAKEVKQPEKPTVQGAEAAIPDFVQDIDLINGFIDEAFEHLETIEVNVLALEHNPDDPDLINNIFRPFHTIKGVSGFLNLKSINKLAHTTENLLDDVRNGVRKMDSEVIDIVLNGGDFLKSMVENVKEVLNKGPEYYKEFDISEFVAQVQAVQKGGTAPSGPEPIVEPAEQPLAEQEVEPGPSEDAKEPASPVKEKAAQAPKGGVAKKIGTVASIKVNVDKLDGLVNAVGELVIMQSLISQNPLIKGLNNPKLVRDFGQLSRITSELQKTAMAMRMVP